MTFTHEMAAARAVCRATNHGLDALDHVVASISAMLDTTRPWTLEDAVTKGYTRLVERLLTVAYGPAPAQLTENDTTMRRALSHAAAGGHLETVQTLLRWHPSCKVAPAMEDAAASGHLEVLTWLHGYAIKSAHPGQRMTLDAMDSAAVNGHLEVVQWLHAHRPEGCTTRAMDGAARAGRLEIVQWLHAHRSEGCTTQAMDGAAANGHLEVLAWLHEHRREGCSSLAEAVAAQNGHAHVVAWLRRVRGEPSAKPLVTWHEKRTAAWPTHHGEMRAAIAIH